MSNLRKRILAGGLIGVAVLTGIYVLLGKTPLVHAAYLFLLLDLVLFCGALWQLSLATKDCYLTGLAFPLALRWLLAVSAVLSLGAVAIQLTVGRNMPWVWFCMVQLLVLACAGWQMLAIGAGEEVIHNEEKQVQLQTFVWKMLRADSETAVLNAPVNAQPDFIRVRDAIRYADPMSIPEVASIEQDIQKKLKQMRDFATQGEDVSTLARQLESLVQERAVRMKLFK